MKKQPWEMTRDEYNRTNKADPDTEKVLWRGVNDDTGERHHVQGKGLYLTADKEYAKRYGQLVAYPLTAKPKNPLFVRSLQDWEGWLCYQFVKVLGMKNIREFYEKYPDPGEYVRSLGYDGVQICTGKDAIYVNYNYPSHKQLVQDAINQGEEVPEEVLQEYPDLL